jgi:hypothetical protein
MPGEGGGGGQFANVHMGRFDPPTGIDPRLLAKINQGGPRSNRENSHSSGFDPVPRYADRRFAPYPLPFVATRMVAMASGVTTARAYTSTPILVDTSYVRDVLMVKVSNVS